MTPAQFLARVKRNEFAPAYLFLGAESYQAQRAREALLDRMLGPEGRENGLTQHDLNESSLAQVVDDARSLSLFAAQRVIQVSNAEAALPRGRSEEEDEASGSGANSATELAEYMKDPSPGVVLLFEATRYEFEGEDADGKLRGHFRCSGLRPHFTPKAAYFGLDRPLLEAMV